MYGQLSKGRKYIDYGKYLSNLLFLEQRQRVTSLSFLMRVQNTTSSFFNDQGSSHHIPTMDTHLKHSEIKELVQGNKLNVELYFIECTREQ